MSSYIEIVRDFPIVTVIYKCTFDSIFTYDVFIAGLPIDCLQFL